jgi:hypothetical protein
VEAERAPQVHSSAFDGRLRSDESLDRSYGHNASNIGNGELPNLKLYRNAQYETP